MDRIEFDSTILAWARYLPDQHLLKLGLRTGQDYDYFDVPAQTYQELLAAESKGRYYNHHIRKDFRFQPVNSRGAG
jgi:hypothetical protein